MNEELNIVQNRKENRISRLFKHDKVNLKLHESNKGPYRFPKVAHCHRKRMETFRMSKREKFVIYSLHELLHKSLD